ncbi:uncharacterized protein DSM5745_05484 [Aspergillus mulundensis]|uniref:Uncharacterized protein n=1 Tax=Aspergillus mulundensis TaxID=1810919 RepID=A0A3D8RX38_9EURO|nr:hypothetical protein DSM5745_05484 [Aspergillus mulundensis]RDW78632.1 hypothetical protein DSM5745_05484 [Aspergillus mulundensis]
MRHEGICTGSISLRWITIVVLLLQLLLRLKAHPNAPQPFPGDPYAGWYRAPNGQRYFGFGTVIEVGVNHDGSRYVEVEPEQHHPGAEFDFFDPFTDEDMDENLYPDWEEREECCERDKFFSDSQDLEPGSIAPGQYMSASGTSYYGLGKVVCATRTKAGVFGWYQVEPMRGGYRFWSETSGTLIPDEDLPRSPYSGSKETQQRENKDRPRRPNYFKLRGWYGGYANQEINMRKAKAKLGTERLGVYFAPDGQWFVGVGKVVTIGMTTVANSNLFYIYVEPISGKSGGEYDFFHPHTCEWMDELPSNPIPGVACTTAQRKTLPPRWRALPAINRRPDIGQEYPGRYFPPGAPRRAVYVGVGKVVKTGVDTNSKIWVEVEPIPGKSGGNYEFFDPFTGKTMPDEYWPDEE